jgi:hypothetical protein
LHAKSASWRTGYFPGGFGVWLRNVLIALILLFGVKVTISDVTFSYVEHELNNPASAATSVTINRASGKYFAYTAHSARKDGRCKKIE